MIIIKYFIKHLMAADLQHNKQIEGMPLVLFNSLNLDSCTQTQQDQFVNEVLKNLNDNKINNNNLKLIDNKIKEFIIDNNNDGYELISHFLEDKAQSLIIDIYIELLKDTIEYDTQKYIQQQTIEAYINKITSYKALLNTKQNVNNRVKAENQALKEKNTDLQKKNKDLSGTQNNDHISTNFSCDEIKQIESNNQLSKQNIENNSQCILLLKPIENEIDTDNKKSTNNDLNNMNKQFNNKIKNLAVEKNNSRYDFISYILGIFSIFGKKAKDFLIGIYIDLLKNNIEQTEKNYIKQQIINHYKEIVTSYKKQIAGINNINKMFKKENQNLKKENRVLKKENGGLKKKNKHLPDQQDIIEQYNLSIKKQKVN